MQEIPQLTSGEADGQFGALDNCASDLRLMPLAAFCQLSLLILRRDYSSRVLLHNKPWDCTWTPRQNIWWEMKVKHSLLPVVVKQPVLVILTGQIHLFYICTFLRDYSFHENTLTSSVNSVSPFTMCDVTNNSAEGYMGYPISALLEFSPLLNCRCSEWCIAFMTV